MTDQKEALELAQKIGAIILRGFANGNALEINFNPEQLLAFSAAQQAKVLEEAENIIASKYTANESIWICNDLHSMAAEKRKQAGQPEGNGGVK